MERAGHNNVKFFVGSEVEHSAAFSKKTLFVVGAELDEIIKAAQEHKVAHVFLTANQSFNKVFNEYDTQASALIDMGYWVTIEYPMEEHVYMLNNLSDKVWQSKLFIPMATCKIRNITNCSHNFTIKIDDPEFNGPNGGVWCWDRAILDSNRFTPWVDYENDEVICTSQVFEIGDEQLEQGALEKIKKGVTQRKAELLADSNSIFQTARTELDGQSAEVESLPGEVLLGSMDDEAYLVKQALRESGIPVYSDGTPAKMLMPGEDEALVEDLFKEIDGENTSPSANQVHVSDAPLPPEVAAGIIKSVLAEEHTTVIMDTLSNTVSPDVEKTTSTSIDGDDSNAEVAVATEKKPKTK